MKIGVLSLQGGVIEHINHITKLGHVGIEIKKLEDINGIQGIILPGGESTTIGKLLRETNMLIPLRDKITFRISCVGNLCRYDITCQIY